MNDLKINFLARAKNKLFWMALIPAVAAVDALFAVLVILGVVVDPTTEGLGDSDRAMTYTKPAPRSTFGDDAK